VKGNHFKWGETAPSLFPGLHPDYDTVVPPADYYLHTMDIGRVHETSLYLSPHNEWDLERAAIGERRRKFRAEIVAA